MTTRDCINYPTLLHLQQICGQKLSYWLWPLRVPLSRRRWVQVVLMRKSYDANRAIFGIIIPTDMDLNLTAGPRVRRERPLSFPRAVVAVPIPLLLGEVALRTLIDAFAVTARANFDRTSDCSRRAPRGECAP